MTRETPRSCFVRAVHLAATAIALLAFVPAPQSRAQPAGDARAKVRISVDMARDGTRVVLNHERQLVYTVRASRGRIEVTYTEPIAPDPVDQKLDDGVLDRFEGAGDRTLIFFTGSGFQTYETFELRNPFRLVIDMQGTRAAKSTPKAAAKPVDAGTVIVLDPGHGGVEHGAVGPSGLREKEVTLDLARRLRQELQKDRGVTVVLTRDEDRYVDLDERTAIANHNNADLFVSIHLNASRRVSAKGAETYFLSADATDDEARTLAALENRAGSDSPSASSSASTKDAATGLELVLWDLAQNQYMAESAALAESVQRHLNELADTRDRGVRQAPFRVLMGATMPAVLVEVGFISNPDEEGRFKTLSYRNNVIDALAIAVREYIAQLERSARPEATPGRSGR